MMSPQDELRVNLYRSHATHISEISISATGDILNQVYDHAVSDLKGHRVPDPSSIILLSSFNGTENSFGEFAEGTGAMHAVVPLETSLEPDLPMPDEGLDRPEFKSALTALLKGGFDEALQNHVVNQKICELQGKVKDLQAMIREEGERYDRESSKLRCEIQELERKFQGKLLL